MNLNSRIKLLTIQILLERNDIYTAKREIIKLLSEESEENDYKEENNKKEDKQLKTLKETEKELIVQTLLKYKDRRRETAISLDIAERTLYRKLKEYNLESK